MKRTLLLLTALCLGACTDDASPGANSLVGADIVGPGFGADVLDSELGASADTLGAVDTPPGSGPDAAVSEIGGPDVIDPPPVDAVTPDTRGPPDTHGPPDTGGPENCVVDADCEGGEDLAPCERWICLESGSCALGAQADDTACSTPVDEGKCASGVCVFACGDGIVQQSEQCDDAGQVSGDGCRDDCVIEEPIGAGFTGGQCQADGDCAPAGSLCIEEVGGGSCSIPCTVYCDDQAGSPVTFCIDAEVYASRMEGPLPVELSPALCVSKCDFFRFSAAGCRAGLHCEQRDRYQTTVRDEVCVPGPWSVGLAFSSDGGQVLGLEASQPEPAEPYSRLLSANCSGVFEPVAAGLFAGLAGTLLAMGGAGHDIDWERLCSATGLPNVHAIGVEAQAGRAFRLVGSRLDVVDWTAAGIYGSKSAAKELVGGPLFAARAMVYRSGGTAYLYADGADDFPYADPLRPRHFARVNGVEWGPLDAELAPNSEYVVVKADGSARFYRQWARLDTVVYIADMGLDHLANHALPMGVGDLSLPTGGDIDGHSSHETGLDVDLYLLTFDIEPDGSLQVDAPELWVAECQSAGGWSCSYHESATGAPEDLADPDHVPAASMLTTLAQYAYDHSGPSTFVQHDVTVLSAFAALPGNKPNYIDASNASAQGWPPHKNHIHIRFSK